jgi:hypothetical protein
MNYAVRWWPLAEAELRRMWARALNPEAVADAADDANRVLGADPTGLGESRGSPARRIWFQRPLCLPFVIDEPNRAVYVADVRRVGY